MLTKRAVGYHGTTQPLARQILESGFQASQHRGDWLGYGAYFWQDSINMAAQWARGRKEFRGYLGPLVLIEAEIDLSHSLDLFDIHWMETVEKLSQKFISQLRKNRATLKNDTVTGEHQLDCAFFNFVIAYSRQRGFHFTSVRAPCFAGQPLFENSPISTRGHVQISVVKPSIISQVSVIAEQPVQGTTWKRGYHS